MFLSKGVTRGLGINYPVSFCMVLFLDIRLGYSSMAPYTFGVLLTDCGAVGVNVDYPRTVLVVCNGELCRCYGDITHGTFLVFASG